MNTMHIKVLYFFLVVLAITFLGVKEAEADCMSGIYKGTCAVWDNEACRRVCKDEGRVGGHCSPRLACWCEGC